MEKIYGYCRVSTKTQNIERQIRNISMIYPNAEIYKEAFTGTKVEGRKEFEKLLKKLRSGDKVVFDSVSRMSRNKEDGVELYFQLMDMGIILEFIKEPQINTEVYLESMQRSIEMTGNEIADCYVDATNKVLRILAKRQVEIAFEQAEKEVEDLHQRTKEGIETARRNGKQIGAVGGKKLKVKKEDKTKELIRLYSKDFNGTMKDSEVMKLVEVSRPTFYKYKKELMETA